MAEYESIHGTRVRYLSSDPTLTESSTEGQVWYNSTSGTNKVLSQIKAWSSSGSLNTARKELAGAGTQTATLAFGGNSGPPSPASTVTEEYNGFSWSEQNDLNTGRRFLAGAGTTSAGLAFGGRLGPGSSTGETEEYNGTSWAEQNDLNTPRQMLSGCGIQTSALAFGGTTTASGATEEYDGTSWTTSPGSMNTARRYLAGVGIQTAALAFGGRTPSEPQMNNSEEYDGSSWTAGNTLNTGRRYLAGAGIQTAASGFGGSTDAAGYQTATEEYDGVSWTNSSASLSTGRNLLSGSGTLYAGLAFGGNSGPPATGVTEEYNSNINAITQSAWSSGGSASSSARNRALGGTQTAAFMSGGYNGANSQTRATEEYNGSSWTSGGDLSPQGNPDGGTYSGAACGTQTAGLFSGGSSQGSTDYYFNVSYEYDGSSWGSPATWTAPGLNGIQLFGTQTAAVNAGGSRPGQPLDRNYEYDGSSWTTGTTLPEGKRSGGQSGILTAGVIFGGSNPGLSPSSPSSTFHYDGTNWTAGGTMNFGSNGGQSSTASSTDTISYQGSDGSSDTGRSQLYNGTAWAIDATAATVTSSLRSGAGTSGAALSAGGSPNAVQEYEGGTEVVTASTLTTS